MVNEHNVWSLILYRESKVKYLIHRSGTCKMESRLFITVSIIQFSPSRVALKACGNHSHKIFIVIWRHQKGQRRVFGLAAFIINTGVFLDNLPLSLCLLRKNELLHFP